MRYKLLSALMMFAAGLFAPAVITQTVPHYHVFVDPGTKTVNLVDIDWLIEHGQILMSTSRSQAPMMQFAWEEEGSQHTLTTRANIGSRQWATTVASIVGLESFAEGKIVPASEVPKFQKAALVPQGQGSSTGGFQTSWVDKLGVTHTVSTPTPSETEAGLDRAWKTHQIKVKLAQKDFPPRPVVTPPPNGGQGGSAFLSDPPKWHRSDPHFHRPEAQLVGKWA